jgi:hypothetical protein
LRNTKHTTSTTYSAVDKIEAAEYPLLLAPFHGVQVWVKAKKLNYQQIQNCGDISLIETMGDKIKAKNLKRRDLIIYAETQHKIVKESLASPTYDEIMEHLGKDKRSEEKKAELVALKDKLKGMHPGPQRAALEEEIDCMRVWVDLILPEDFIGFIVSFALSVNESAIKEISEKMLLDAAILADKFGKLPSDIVCRDAFFTPFNKLDIDKRAMLILYEWKEKNKPQSTQKGMPKIGR